MGSPATGRLKPTANSSSAEAESGVRIIPTPSPNFGPRRHGRGPDMVVLHHTAMESCEAAIARLCAPEFEVSAHYVISEYGEVFSLVDEEMRAWHAGAGSWGAVRDVNSHSVGIELANPGPLAAFPPFPAPQMDALEELLHQITTRWAIPPERVIAHSDMAPGRKADPGAKFDWQRLARHGLSVWPEAGAPVDPAPAVFRQHAEALGYGVEHSDETILTAFRLRFRPDQEGPLDAGDTQMVSDLARRFPVDRTITTD